MAFCLKCGKQLPEGAAFCNGCGAKQPGASYQPEPSYQPENYYQPEYPTHSPYTAPTAVKAAKAGSSLMKWLLPLLAAVVVVSVVVYVMFGTNLLKSDEELIRERIEALEEAYNEGDYEGILECMDGQTQAMMEVTMGFMDGILGEATGMDFGMSDAFGLAGIFGEYCSIDIQSIEIDGDYATVSVIMSVDLMGNQDSEEGELPMVKEDGDWYIGGTDEMFDLGDLGFPA